MSKLTVVGIIVLVAGLMLLMRGCAGHGASLVPGYFVVILGVAMAVAGYVTGVQQRRETEIKELGIMVVTTDTIPGKKIVKTLGQVRARNSALLSHQMAGWSLEQATESDARRNLMKEAQALGANAIVGAKTERHESKGDVTYYVYGTAVIAEDDD